MIEYPLRKMKNRPIYSNNTVWRLNTCDVCGKEAECTVCSSTFGATSFAYCEDCFDTGKQPYDAIVNYISSAGHWPQDINETYQREVRRQLVLHKKPEEIFTFDVERAIAEERAMLIELSGGRIEF